MWDHYFYIQMATDYASGEEERPAPFEYRLLNPFLAKLLPFDLQINFTILNLAALSLTGVVLYLTLKRFGFSKTLAMTGLIFYLALGWVTKYNIFDFWLTDPLSFLFIVAIMWSIFAREDLAFLILLAIGVSAKENVLFVALLYYTFNAKRFFDAKTLLRTLYLAAPALAVLFVIRMFVPTTNLQYYNLQHLIETIGVKRIQRIMKEPNEYLLQYSIGVFGVSLMFLPLFAIRENVKLFLKVSPLIAMSYLSLLFAYNEERLIVVCFPAMILLALSGIKNIVEKTKVDERVFLLLPTCLFLLIAMRKDWFVVLPVYEIIVLLLVLAVSIQAGSLKPDFQGRSLT